jgi:hypothetical protein
VTVSHEPHLNLTNSAERLSGHKVVSFSTQSLEGVEWFKELRERGEWMLRKLMSEDL